MQTVRHEDGTPYLLLERSGDTSTVRDLETGEKRRVESDRLAVVADQPPLETAADAVPGAVRRVLTATHSEIGLGLLVDLHDHGPRSVRQMLDAYDACESDLHGLLAEFTVAGLVEEAEVLGERGYGLTDVGDRGVRALRES